MVFSTLEQEQRQSSRFFLLMLGASGVVTHYFARREFIAGTTQMYAASRSVLS
jgi:hypothetical protein